MESVKLDGERGQILVQVAIMVVVLFAFVALALDGGQIYAGRRRMQNAADAGALAGAREICFGGHSTLEAAQAAAEAAAHEYAEDRNGAQGADVEIWEDYTVIVTAEQTLDTFFAGVIGINTANVRAEAAAVCGGTVSAEGGLWPLAFEYNVYTDTDRIPCNTKFLVFTAKAGPGELPDETTGPDLNCAPDCCYDSDWNPLDNPPEWCECSGKCNCTGVGIHFETDERGWLRFPDPGDVYEDNSCNNYDCGANSLKCFIEYDHPGPITQGDCIPGEPGVSSSVQNPVEERISDTVQIILWDLTPCEEEDVLGTCPGDWYYVRDFGCVTIDRWIQTYKLSSWNSPATCAQFQAIEATKRCKGSDLYQQFCSTPGSTTGVPPEEWESRSVSLIQWPPSGSP